MFDFIQETKAQVVRWLIHLRREPFNMAFNLLNPVILLIFMGGAFQAYGRNLMLGDYRAYLLPGILTLTVFGNSMGGGIPLLFDKENGLLSRLLTAPVSRASILVGRFLAVNINTTLQCLIMLGLGLVFGVRVATGIGGILGLLIVALLLGFGVTVISMVLAFVVHNHGDFFAIMGITALPFTFLSSAFVPLDALPGWMQLVARVNPMTYAIDGMRSLVLLDPSTRSAVWDWHLLGRMVVVLLVFDALVLWLGARALRRHLQ
ncbi:MAG: ABC transporter permease [Deltaproteobacteria bacterium]|nr:ABC transporter permease [Deltaproteobacteria bacterium]